MNTLQLQDQGWYRFARRGLRVMAVAFVISLVSVGAYHQKLWPWMMYSMCITLGCWFFIDGGRLLVAHWHDRGRESDGQWPGWPWMVGILDSSRYASLHPGYYVIFQGVYADEAAASSALQRARSVFPSAYQREIVP